MNESVRWVSEERSENWFRERSEPTGLWKRMLRLDADIKVSGNVEKLYFALEIGNWYACVVCSRSKNIDICFRNSSA